MKPPHYLCKRCGSIIIDLGNEARDCVRCGGKSWHYLGHEGEYDIDDVLKDFEHVYNIDHRLKELK